MKKYFTLIFPLAAVIAAVFLFQSRSREDFLLAGSGQQKQELAQLFDLLAHQPETGAARFTLLQQITDSLKKTNDLGRINLFLTNYVAANPSDPFNARYLYEVAENYRQAGANSFAVHYYERILKGQPDILINSESVHYLCLSYLIKLDDNPGTRLGWFQELLARFPDAVANAETYYYLGKTLENLGQWEQAVDAYGTFLHYPEASVKGDPKAFSRAENLVNFYHADKKWISQDFDTLLARLKTAISTGNIELLETLRAKVNFVARSWNDRDSPLETSDAFDIWPFLRSNVRISMTPWGSSMIEFDKSLATDSSETEALIRTKGWNYRIPTWYFYFRKIDFPPDPEVNGAWEWAGVYFGEKL